MSSIYSTLNTINSALLSDIGSSSTGKTGSTGAAKSSGATSAASTTSGITDQIDFSQVTTLLKQLQTLQQSNPAEFKQVLNDGATQLQTAANTATDPNQAKFLNSLAGQFQNAATTGDLSQVRYGLVTGTTTPQQNLFSYIVADQSNTNDSTQNLLTSIFNTGSANTTSGQINNLLVGLFNSGN